MERELTLRIVLEAPPAGVDFGLQKGRGSDYETIQTQRSKDEDLRFEFAVRVKTEGQHPNFLDHLPKGLRLHDSFTSTLARVLASPIPAGAAG